MIVLGNEDVLGLNVAMHHLVHVQVLQSGNNVVEVFLGVVFGENAIYSKGLLTLQTGELGGEVVRGRVVVHHLPILYVLDNHVNSTHYVTSKSALVPFRIVDDVDKRDEVGMAKTLHESNLPLHLF